MAGVPEAVKAQTALSIVGDVVQRQMVPIPIAARTAVRLADESSEKAREEFPRLERYKREAGTAQRALRNWVLDYFNEDRKSTRLNSVTWPSLVCRLLLEKKNRV